MQYFETKPQVLEKWRNKFRFILIDEFQDINKIQYDIIDMFARPLNNIFAVGTMTRAYIVSWRKAGNNVYV